MRFLVLLLLLPLAQASVAPVQTILDAVPLVVDEAIEESTFDGSPDRAYALLGQMEAFVADFDALPPWPGSSNPDAVYAFAQEVVAVARLLPREIALVERGRAACGSWQANATAQDAETWGAWVVPSSARSATAGLLLAERARDLDGRLDVAPLEAAVAALEAWQVRAQEARSCVFELATRVGAVIDVPEVLLVVPSTTWPGGSFRVAGTASEPLRIDVEGIGAQDVPAGPYSVRFQVPVDARIGPHVVSAGLQVTLHVIPAPVRMHIDAPAVASGPFDVNVTLTSTVPITGPITITGDLEATTQSGHPVTFHADRPLFATVHYAGSNNTQPADGAFSVRVPSSHAATAPDAQAWPGFLLVAAVALAAVILAAFALRSVPKRTPRPAVPPRTLPSRGFARAFAAMHAMLVRLGIITPGTTGRDLAERTGLDAKPVRAFEMVRYGPYRETDAIHARGPGWVQRAWQRLRGGP